ncbi:MAG: 6-bladed beta-propeller [Tannerellaceae bacterium]|nr:6-bladed beta-propeller [Tannerellaceae bacterium]
MIKIILLILLITNFACSESVESNYEMIHLGNILTQVEELSVRDMGELINYIPLETTNESLIGKRAYVRVLKDKILVGSFQQPIKMFDKKTGKFIRMVGAIGQGANEYTLQDEIPVFWTDDVQETIYVQTEGSNVLCFDVDGNPLSNICLPDDFPSLTAVSQITTENKLYIYKQTLFTKEDYKIYMYDLLNGQIKKYFSNSDEIISTDFSQMPLIISGYGSIPISPSCHIFSLKGNKMVLFHTENPCLWTFNREVYFKENFNDTIYQIKGDKINPVFVFDLGNRHCSYEDRFNIEGSQNKISIDYILEGKKVLFFVFRTNYYHLQESKTYLGVYNKHDKSIQVTDKPYMIDAKNSFIIEPLQTATSDGQLVGLIDASSFTGNMNMENILGLSEEDNPIVVIVE